MKKFLSILLVLLMVFTLVGCGQKKVGVTEKATVLESGADQKGSYLVVEYLDGMVEKLWNANPFYTYGIKGGTRVIVTSKENLEITAIKFGW